MAQSTYFANWSHHSRFDESFISVSPLDEFDCLFRQGDVSVWQPNTKVKKPLPPYWLQTVPGLNPLYGDDFVLGFQLPEGNQSIRLSAEGLRQLISQNDLVQLTEREKIRRILNYAYNQTQVIPYVQVL